MRTPADEYLIQQTPHTFDTVFTSDRKLLRPLLLQRLKARRRRLLRPREGIGIYEVILIGPHKRYGFERLTDPAR